jgi:4-amino-4-deoxy-L-arabinose transferase-like glycosyltransferase
LREERAAVSAGAAMIGRARRLGDWLGQLRFVAALAGVAALALALRLALRWHRDVANYWGEGYGFFWDIARNLAAGRGYEMIAGTSTAFRVPGYPLFLLGVTGGGWHPWAMVWAGALLGTLTVVATGLMARELFGRAAGLIAAGLCAVYPYYLWHDTALQETALVTCLTAWATLVLLRFERHGGLRRAVLAGVLLAAAVLTRETVLPFALCACLWTAWRVAARTGAARGALAGAAMLGTIGAGLAPWLIHTHREYGEYVLGSEFGAALHAGSSPLLFSAYPDGSVDDSRVVVWFGLSEGQRAVLDHAKPLERDHWLRDAGLRQIEADPLGWAARGLRKVWVAFRPLPSPLHGRAENLGYAVIWVPLLLLGLAGMWRSRSDWRRLSLIHAQFVLFAGITAVLWAQTAHRVFLDCYLMVFAAGFIVQWMGTRPLQQDRHLCQGGGIGDAE